MNDEIKALTDLASDPQNRRAHNPRNLDMIGQSFAEVGAGRSILIDENNQLIAGEGAVKGALAAGLEKVRIIDADGSEVIAVRRSDLTPEEKRKMAIYDNRTAELATWDIEQLVADMDAGLDMEAFFYEDELAALVAGLDGANGYGEAPDPEDPDADDFGEIRPKRGDVWLIASKTLPGKFHRIMCGDSTSTEDVARVMRGEMARLFATDPPYGCNAGNVGYTAQRDDIEAITKDDLNGIEMQQFLETVFRAFLPHLADNTAWYLWHPMLTQGYFAAAAAAAAADLIIHRQIIWRKPQFIFGRGDYHWRHELCFYGWRQGNRPKWFTERNQDTVWDIDYDVRRSEAGHPTAKPVEIFARPMRNHTVRGEICADPFAGSGSQFVAAEQLGRLCYGLEISERYCEVILRRAEAMGLTVQREDVANVTKVTE